MDKHRDAAKSLGVQMDASPTLLSHGGELSDTAQDQIEEVALMEEVLSQMSESLRTPFRFIQLSRLPSVHSLSLECWWAYLTTPNDQMGYCVHVRVTLGEGRGD